MKLPMVAMRAIKRMNQQEVADAVGVTVRTYIKWEKYITFPNALQLRKLAEVFGVKMDDIYFPEEKEETK